MQILLHNIRFESKSRLVVQNRGYGGGTMTNTQHRLSKEAIKEYQDIYTNEFGVVLTDDEADEMGWRLLEFFDTLSTPIQEEASIEVTEQEWKALEYIHQCPVHDKKQPTVRGIANAIGRTSSRSGLRMLAKLEKKGLMYWDKNRLKIQGRVDLR